MSIDPEKIGRYEIQSAIGRGAMGVVYLAIDPLLKRSVAVKIMRDKGEDVSNTIERFKREAEISAKLNHPNIITVYDVGVDSESGPFLTMEYVMGASLAHFIKEGLPVDSILRLLLQGASALEAAQMAGIVHRDVKPENMLVSQEGRLKLMDFGLARGDQSRLTAEGMVFGTPSYTAPELLIGSNPSSATDRYAFAVTAFEAFTGTLPFQGSSVGSTLYRIVHEAPTIPSTLEPALRDIFLRALSKDPSERFHDLTSFLEALIHSAPMDEDQRSKLLDGLEYDKTNSGAFVFSANTSGSLPVVSNSNLDLPSNISTQRTDPRSSDRFPEPLAHTLPLKPSPETEVQWDGPLPERPTQLPTVALPQMRALAPQKPNESIPLDPPKKGGRRLLFAILGMLFLGGLGVGGHLLTNAKKSSRSVEILSDPVGATVFLEGDIIGHTPLRHVALKGDASALMVKMEGFVPQRYRIKDGDSVVSMVLKRPFLFISVTTDPEGAEVFLDGKSMGLTPLPHLPISSEGMAKMRIVHEGYIPWEAEVDTTYLFPEIIRLTPLPKPRK